MKVKIVQFSDGSFAVRKGWLFKRYANISDLRHKEDIYWWQNESAYKECFTHTNLEELEAWVEKNKKVSTKEFESLVETNVMSIHKIENK